MMFIGNLNYVVIAVVGGLRVASGTMSLGDVQAFIQYSRQFTQPLTQVASMANLLQSGVASAERVFEVLDAPEQEPDAAHADRRSSDPHGASRSRTSRSPTRPDKPLIEHLDLVVEPGPDGRDRRPDRRRQDHAGQPDHAVLRAGLRPDHARRRRHHRPDAARPALARSAWCCRTPGCSAGTIRDNIAYGRPGATEEEVLAAARATYVDRFVHSLPDGYDTVLDAEAGNISAGEKQLITIARAFLSDPALLILDEATRSVDTRTELLVQQAMAALRSDRTSFVIAHRLSTIRDADLILVMEDGRIVEQGSHAELLAAGGAYAELYAAQFQRRGDRPRRGARGRGGRRRDNSSVSSGD